MGASGDDVGSERVECLNMKRFPLWLIKYDSNVIIQTSQKLNKTSGYYYNKIKVKDVKSLQVSSIMKRIYGYY